MGEGQIYNRFKQELGSVDWKRLLLGKSVSDMWESFKDQRENSGPTYFCEQVRQG